MHYFYFFSFSLLRGAAVAASSFFFLFSFFLFFFSLHVRHGRRRRRAVDFSHSEASTIWQYIRRLCKLSPTTGNAEPERYDWAKKFDRFFSSIFCIRKLCIYLYYLDVFIIRYSDAGAGAVAVASPRRYKSCSKTANTRSYCYTTIERTPWVLLN